MRSLRYQITSGLLLAGMIVVMCILLGAFSILMNRAFAPEVVLKSSDEKADCYVKQTPLGIEIVGSLSCVPKKGGA